MELATTKETEMGTTFEGLGSVRRPTSKRRDMNPTKMDPETKVRRKAITKASVVRVYELKLALAKNETDRATLRANIAKAST